MLECVIEFQFSCSSGNFDVGGLLACLHPKHLLPVFGCKHRMSSVLVRSSVLL